MRDGRVLAETTRRVAASPAEVWALWLDVPQRPDWHPRLEWAKLHGPPAHGVAGAWKPRGVRPVGVEVTELERERRLVLRGVHGLPVARGHYEHELALDGDGSLVTHRMRLTGPLAGPIARFFGGALGAFATAQAMDAFEATLASRADAPRR